MIRLLWTALVLTQTPGGAGARSFNPRPLSSFQRAKAEALLRHRLPCLGCHELAGEGGRIAPSLSDLHQSTTRRAWSREAARWRRVPTADYVYAIIRDPQGTAPGTIMPHVPMTQATLELIASYLVQREPTTGTPPAVRPSEPASDSVAPAPPAEPASAAVRYGRFCAPCHGVGGRGDGYNVPFLPVRPTAHADSAYMSRRSDDALFDATYAGGFIMNRSNRMPPFGQTLTRDQIWELVRYLRRLCRCEGPAWSRENP